MIKTCSSKYKITEDQKDHLSKLIFIQQSGTASVEG